MSGKRHEGDVHSYSENFIDCRENHLWQWVTDWGITRGPGGRLMEFKRQKRCQNCATVAIRTYDGHTGRVLATRYIYPDGYLSPKGSPIDAGSARLEMLRREGIKV